MPINDVFNFENSYATELEGFYVPWKGERVPDPQIVQLNEDLAAELQLDPATLRTDAVAALFTGAVAPEGAVPLAQVYAGHQFGGFSPQLGDGRALLIGELIDRNGVRRDLQLKGSGPTPFSRRGDGKAVLGPVLREYLLGEAMHALGIPTTRALAAVTTGEQIMRQGPEPGAVLVRVAQSHVRVGTFQFFAARRQTEQVKQLADYSIRRHFPDLVEAPNPYLALLAAVRDRQAAVVAQWLGVGFVHGVMNTDNMAISGETLDYGPCAFIDHYDPAAVFSSIDTHGRYAYRQQPTIAQWNLARLAETLVPLINSDDTEQAVEIATEEVDAFAEVFREEWLGVMAAKIGLDDPTAEDLGLINGLHRAMTGQHVDFTMFFRRLADDLVDGGSAARALFDDPAEFETWLPDWLDRLEAAGEPAEQVAARMNTVNPLYIARNHKVEEALAAASDDADYVPFQRLLETLKRPFDVQPGREEYEGPAPGEFGPYVTYCGT